MGRDIHAEIQKEVTGNRITLYMKGTPDMPRCGFSNAVVQVLNEIGKPYHAVNVLEDQEKWAAVKVFSNWPTIPQLYIGGEFIGGCDIALDLHRKGELVPRIEKAFAASGPAR